MGSFEERLENERRFRTVAEDQTEVICRFRADDTILFVNDVYCRFFSKRSDEVVGTKWHPVAHPDDLPLIAERLMLLSPANPVVQIENRVFNGSAELRWMQFANRGFFDREGNLLEIQSVGRDIPERRQAEEAVRLANVYTTHSQRKSCRKMAFFICRNHTNRSSCWKKSGRF